MSKSLRTGIAWAGVLAAVPLLPVALTLANVPLAGFTYGKRYQPFELLGFCGSVVVAWVAWSRLRRLRPVTWRPAAEVLLPTLVLFSFLAYFAEHSRPSWDYGCYQRAATAVTEHRNPYQGTNYLYPPLTAQVLAWTYETCRSAASHAPVQADLAARQDSAWFLVFYAYQYAQLLALVCAYFLCGRLARRLIPDPLVASALTAALFLFNTPLDRTLQHNQVNLWLLAIVVASMLYSSSRPGFVGWAIALGTHIKLFPALLLAPAALARRWRVVLWSLAGIGAVALVQTSGGTDWRIWRDFAGALGSFPHGEAFRDNSLDSVTFNVARFLVAPLLRLPAETWRSAVPLVVMAEKIVVLAWFAARAAARERRSGSAPTFYRLGHHTVDAIGLMLLLSPLVWEHHYVIAVPLAIWAVALFGASLPWQVGMGVFLIFVPPTFDVFPFSYHRLAGLLLLLWSMNPGLASFPKTQVD